MPSGHTRARQHNDVMHVYASGQSVGDTHVAGVDSASVPSVHNRFDDAQHTPFVHDKPDGQALNVLQVPNGWLPPAHEPVGADGHVDDEQHTPEMHVYPFGHDDCDA